MICKQLYWIYFDCINSVWICEFKKLWNLWRNWFGVYVAVHPMYYCKWIFWWFFKLWSYLLWKVQLNWWLFDLFRLNKLTNRILEWVEYTLFGNIIERGCASVIRFGVWEEAKGAGRVNKVVLVYWSTIHYNLPK